MRKITAAKIVLVFLKLMLRGAFTFGKLQSTVSVADNKNNKQKQRNENDKSSESID